MEGVTFYPGVGTIDRSRPDRIRILDDTGAVRIILRDGFIYISGLLYIGREPRKNEKEDMSLGLSLLPVECLESPAFCQTVLEVAPSPDLLREVQEIPAQPVPRRFNTYLCEHESSGDPRYGNTQTTGSGEKLMMVAVRELLRFADHPGVFEEPQNRAVWAYLRELPEDSMIALYWD